MTDICTCISKCKNIYLYLYIEYITEFPSPIPLSLSNIQRQTFSDNSSTFSDMLLHGSVYYMVSGY